MVDLQLDRLRSNIGQASLSVQDVSKWSVGQQLQHCGLAMVRACEELIASTPPVPRAGFSLPRMLVLTTGWIPRGRAKAPDVVVPDPNPTIDQIREILDQSQQRIGEAMKLDRKAWFNHPMLGPMSRDTALRFLAIHNRHHLRIIADIIHSARGR